VEIKKWLLLTVERFCISQLEINQSECHKRSKLSVSGEVYYSFLTAKERAKASAGTAETEFYTKAKG